MRLILAAAGILGLTAAASAATLTVPSDAYATLQAAVDAAMPGDTILLQAGIYPAGADVIAKTDLRILGKGDPVIDGGGGGNAFNVNTCDGLAIFGITVRGFNNGIYVYDSTDVRVSRVALGDINYEAVGISGSTGVSISRCTFTTVGGKGVEDDGSTGIVVDRCVFTDCGEGAIVLSPLNAAGAASEGARVTRCVVTGATPGILAGGAGMVFDRNRFTVDGGLAIDLATTAGADAAVITRNTFTMTGTDRSASVAGTGILFSRNRITGGGVIEQGDQNTLEKNTVGASDFGIAVNGSGATIRNNRLADLAGNGLDLSSAGHVIEKNRIDRSGNAGIYGSVTGTTFTGNRVTDAPYGIIVVYAGNTLSRNRVAGETTLDLWDMEVGGANTYGTNAFRTTLFGPGP